MPIRTDWIPSKNAAIYGKLRGYLTLIVANKVAWGIADAAIQPLLDLQTEFEPLYHKITDDKRRRTSSDVTAFNDCKKRLLAEWRAFHKEEVRGNRKISPQDLAALVGKEYDLEPTPRGKIPTIPYILAKAVGGGTIEIRARVEKDKTNTSMHALADAVECKYILVPQGEMPPEDPESCPKTAVSKKARFTIALGVKSAGQSFYGFFRWANITNPQNSSDWTTKPLGAVIS
ncbi:MAG: hypothetical protein AB1599_05090 [Planctomycetota bacterium]